MISDPDRTRVGYPTGTSPMTPAGQRHPNAAPSPVPHRADVITTVTVLADLIEGASPHPARPGRPEWTQPWRRGRAPGGGE